MNQSERRQYLIRELIAEDKEYQRLAIPKDEGGQKVLLRALMNVRAPKPCGEEFLKIQDAYLQEEIRKEGITDADSLTPVRDGLYIWQGDITTLRCDAIVNAANGGMTGCYVPSHRCIDNMIHSKSGIALRLCCADLMKKQGHEEPAGRAKITPAFNLPCRYILHTVGPIIYDRVRKEDERLLASCYRSCLELADENGIRSIAFCCISTGEFHFPNELAAEIAVRTVKEYRNGKTGIEKVIFNVFKDIDKEIYERLLGAD